MPPAFWHVPLLDTLVFDSSIEEVIDQPSQFIDELQAVGQRMLEPALSIAGVLILALIMLRLLRVIVRRTVTQVMTRREEPNRELTLKANTLASVVESLGRMIILVIASLMILANLNMDIAPLIASAGVAGIAIGLGAQSLIRDFISGFMILFEDQFGVGDVILVNGQSGVVEILNLRRTSLRAVDGSLITIPNGDIRTVANLTKDWSRALLDVDISYDDDVDHAIEVLTSLLDGIENDSQLGSAIMAPAEILGVQALGPYQVTIRAMIKTLPMEQWRVMRELRRRIKRAFEENGIKIPYPHNVTVVRSANQEDREASALLAAQNSGKDEADS